MVTRWKGERADLMPLPEVGLEPTRGVNLTGS